MSFGNQRRWYEVATCQPGTKRANPGGRCAAGGAVLVTVIQPFPARSSAAPDASSSAPSG